MADPNQPGDTGSHDSHSVAREGSPHRSPPPGPYGPQEFFQHMASVLQSTVPVPAPRSAVERLSKYRPVDFLGRKEDDPTTAEAWLERMERTFKQMHCTPAECLECIITLLQEDAYSWWTSISDTLPAARITWDFFKDEFKKEYIGRIYLNPMRKEFMYLKQKQMTVVEYQREFVRLSNYGKGMIENEAEKCRKFEEGLNDYIRWQITALQIENFHQLVGAALKVEKLRDEEMKWKNKSSQKRPMGQASSNPTFSKKPKASVPQVSGRSFTPRQGLGQASKAGKTVISVASTPGGATQKGTDGVCDFCGKGHAGECWLKKGACLRCGSMEHFFRDCPKFVPRDNPQSRGTQGQGSQQRKSGAGTAQRALPSGTATPAAGTTGRAPARAYAIKAREDVEEAEIIIGDKGKGVESSHENQKV